MWHRRNSPVRHEFQRKVSYVWLDPDQPEDLCRHHWLWSARRAAPCRFRAADYGDATFAPLGEQVRCRAADVLGHWPAGPVRMLTQVRRFGWLFNPITVYLVWEIGVSGPTVAVLEVTNTPWKQRHHYTIPLTPDGPESFIGVTAKALHVSPFLEMAYSYRLTIQSDLAALHRPSVTTVAAAGRGDLRKPEADQASGSRPGPSSGPGHHAAGALQIALTVWADGAAEPVLETALAVSRVPASRVSLGRALWSRPWSTMAVSAGIHVQAAFLWAKRVPFVAHPTKSKVIS